MSKFNADNLQDMFSKVEHGEITKEDAAAYHQKSIGSINNYFQAKKAYDKGREVCAQNISVKAFTPWAVKYGGKGEPVYKQDPHPERKHTKKESDQIKMDLDTSGGKEVTAAEDNEALRIRVSFELGETAKKAIDGLLALVGVKL